MNDKPFWSTSWVLFAVMYSFFAASALAFNSSGKNPTAAVAALVEWPLLWWVFGAASLVRVGIRKLFSNDPRREETTDEKRARFGLPPLGSKKD